MITNAAKAYARESVFNKELRLAINLSANAFENEELAVFIEKTFAKNNVPADKIIFEITESLAVRKPLHVEREITALRKLGCQFALDDFGTGYSSFSYLQKLHFDYIKIDGTFVQDLPNNRVDQKMIKLIAEIGREAGMKTVAEYVTNADSFSLLGELGVDLAQGYYIGRPAKNPNKKATPISLTADGEALGNLDNVTPSDIIIDASMPAAIYLFITCPTIRKNHLTRLRKQSGHVMKR